MKLQHSENPKKPRNPFICDLCGKSFTYKEGLRSHMGTYHTGEKTFSCPECGKSFFRRQGRDRCKKKHEGKESFKHNCEFCGRKFQDKVKLTLHLRTHTQEKPYSCPLCSYKAARRDYMTKHVASQHKETSVELLLDNFPNFLDAPSSRGDCPSLKSSVIPDSNGTLWPSVKESPHENNPRHFASSNSQNPPLSCPPIDVSDKPSFVGYEPSSSSWVIHPTERIAQDHVDRNNHEAVSASEETNPMVL